jgi:hypothetical protein
LTFEIKIFRKIINMFKDLVPEGDIKRYFVFISEADSNPSRTKSVMGSNLAWGPFCLRQKVSKWWKKKALPDPNPFLN